MVGLQNAAATYFKTGIISACSFRKQSMCAWHMCASRNTPFHILYSESFLILRKIKKNLKHFFLKLVSKSMAHIVYLQEANFASSIK
jgi:hypothetical protein